ncbi:MAG: Clp protease, partial [Edafosvirus sp.]
RAKRKRMDDDEENEKEDDVENVEECIYDIDNHIYFRMEITSKSANHLAKLLISKNREFELFKQQSQLVDNIIPKPIYLHISSEGGNILDSFLIVDVITRSKIPIHTVVEGKVASGASLISVVGKKRYMTPNAYILIHQMSDSIKGKYEYLIDEQKNNMNIMNKLKNIYLDNSQKKLSKKKLEDILKHEYLLDSDECLKLGLVDDIYTESF